MFSVRKLFAKDGTVPDAVYFEIIATLYGTLVPIVSAGIALAIVGTITALETSDVATAALTAAGVTVTVARTFDVMAYRRRIDAATLARTEAVAWEWRYAAGSGITALIIGLFAARSLMLGDAICSVMAIGIAFGFGAGVVARLSLRPAVAIADLVATGLPVIIVTFMQPDIRHIGLGAMLVIYLVASLEMVRLTYSATISQITLKQQFAQLARLDPLTGVFNRAVLDTDMARLVAARQARVVAVHAIDLDHFKAANDRFGHPVGDALLRQVAGRLQSIARPGDLIVRMGGDEFVLVQGQAACREDAEAMARRIFDEVCAPYRIGDHEIIIGVSIGVALSPDDGQSVEGLLASSDAALYQAKENRGGYVMAGNLLAEMRAKAGSAEAAAGDRELAA